VVNENFEARY